MFHGGAGGGGPPHGCPVPGARPGRHGGGLIPAMGQIIYICIYIYIYIHMYII